MAKSDRTNLSLRISQPNWVVFANSIPKQFGKGKFPQFFNSTREGQTVTDYVKGTSYIAPRSPLETHPQLCHTTALRVLPRFSSPRALANRSPQRGEGSPRPRESGEMVLAQLGGSLSRALARMTSATVVDERVLGDCLNEITRALLQADVQFDMVRGMQASVKRAIDLGTLAAGTDKRRVIKTVMSPTPAPPARTRPSLT